MVGGMNSWCGSQKNPPRQASLSSLLTGTIRWGGQTVAGCNDSGNQVSKD